MKAIVVLILGTLMAGMSPSPGQSQEIVGSWKVEITFANGETRSLRFDAQVAGKGSFTLLTPQPISVAQAKGAGEWAKTDNGTTTFSGPVQFPLGNVGVLHGKLVLLGKFQSDNSISGEASFFRIDEEAKGPEDKPSKTGTFKAIRGR